MQVLSFWHQIYANDFERKIKKAKVKRSNPEVDRREKTEITDSRHRTLKPVSPVCTLRSCFRYSTIGFSIKGWKPTRELFDKRITITMYARVKRYAGREEMKKFHVRRFCSTNLKHVDATIQPKPFEDIPGPRSLPVIGTLYKYLPYIGKHNSIAKIIWFIWKTIWFIEHKMWHAGEYSFTKLHTNGFLKLKRYGPLVREEIVPGESIIWVFRPEDVAEIFKAEAGLHPERKSHLALLKYRKDRRDVYNTGGLLPTSEFF